MFKRVGQFLLVSALVFSIGAHWVMLQSVAWVGMAVSFAQTDPLPEALRKTFDGQHPCGLCKIVAEGQQTEKKQATQSPRTKLDYCLAARLPVLVAPLLNELARFEPGPAEARTETPPSPPPRRA